MKNKFEKYSIDDMKAENKRLKRTLIELDSKEARYYRTSDYPIKLTRITNRSMGAKIIPNLTVEESYLRWKKSLKEPITMSIEDALRIVYVDLCYKVRKCTAIFTGCDAADISICKFNGEYKGISFSIEWLCYGIQTDKAGTIEYIEKRFAIN